MRMIYKQNTYVFRQNEKRIGGSTMSKYALNALQGSVSSRVTQFHDKVEALTKPTPEWTISPGDPL